MIAELVTVYKVTTAAIHDDYHKNVDRVEFTRWFTSLLKHLKTKTGGHIIIMDNAR